MKKITVLVVDDSAIVRNAFLNILSKTPEIDVIGTAADPYEARDKIVELKPDVITLDINMPRMDGLTFLKKLMKHFPLPVIMVSGVSDENAKITLKSLELGAVEFVAKPGGGPSSLKELSFTLVDKIKAAASAKIGRNHIAESGNIGELPASMVKHTNKIIAIGASTGGTEAIRTVLKRMPANSPPILVVQHMPGNFTKTFSDSLNDLCSINVREAKNGDKVEPGLALVAPGNYHMTIRKAGINYSVSVDQTERVTGHRPSVNAMFNSVAKHSGGNCVATLMTGMGADGAIGLLNLKNSGARTIAQDEQSSVVFGMPKEAIKLGAAEKIASLNNIASTILNML